MKHIGVVIATLLLLFSTTAMAEPKQLNILGLVPGVSTIEDVKNAGGPVPEIEMVYKTGEWVLLEIGGHKMKCIAQYLSGVLVGFNCAPEARDKETVFRDLSKGYIEEFEIGRAHV